MEVRDIISSFSQQLAVKKIKVESLKDLKSGSLFLQAIHVHFPKYVDLTKIYLKPKNSFEVLQNYKHIMAIFNQLNWKRLDPQKYVKQQDKDCLQIANFIIKKLTAAKKQKQKEHIQETNGIDKKNENKDESVSLKIKELSVRKQKLLDIFCSIQHVLEEATDPKIAKNLIVKMIQQ